MNPTLLEIEAFTVSLVQRPQKKILDRVSLIVPQESIVAVVGGSGSGKTTTGLGILRLLPSALECQSGQIRYKGEDLLTMREEKMRSLRGKEIAMVFQDPLQSFNPVFKVGHQIAEVVRTHSDLPSSGVQGKVLELLAQVGLNDPMRVYNSYPHQLSGGMRQRAMIAQAVAVSPSLLIADEPTSSLDVTLQARILDVFRSLRDLYKLSIILITHDLQMVSHIADYVVVMNHGKIVENGTVKKVLSHPQHEYTQQLIGAMNP